jgi:hypothetical protein
LQRLLASGVLALLFVLVQQHASLHWLGHAVDSLHQKAAPAGEACDECAGLAAFAAAAPSHSPLLPTFDAEPELRLLAAPASAATAQHLAFRSRAPPVLS